MYRINNGELEIFLAHPGGPYFFKKDNGIWSIPKGEIDYNENLFETAVREFEEETGIKPKGKFIPLGSIIQKGGKEVFAWAFEGNLPENYEHKSNMFYEQWPPNSGQFKPFPEIDKVKFFTVNEAKQKIKKTQIPLIERLIEKINSN